MKVCTWRGANHLPKSRSFDNPPLLRPTSRHPEYSTAEHLVQHTLEGRGFKHDDIKLADPSLISNVPGGREATKGMNENGLDHSGESGPQEDIMTRTSSQESHSDSRYSQISKQPALGQISR